MPKTETHEQREKRLEYLREWRRNNKVNRSEASKEKSKKRMRDQYANDHEYRECLKRKSKEYRKANPKKVKASNDKWKAKNKKKSQTYHRIYNANRYKTDPEFRLRSLEAQSVWRLKNWRKENEGDAWIHDIPNKDIDKQLIRRLRAWQNGYCYFCNCKSDILTIEHILPRSRGGPTIPQNLVLTCPRCNFSRQSKIFNIEWLPEGIAPYIGNLTLVKAAIEKLLTANNLLSNINDTYFELTGPLSTRNLYIISTFVGSSRNPGSNRGREIKRILSKDENAIVIMDREWFHQNSAVLNLLRAKVGIAPRLKSARQLKLMELDAAATKTFLNEHHLMGNRTAAIRVGLVADNVIYGVGVFTDVGEYFECDRLAFRGHVAGGMSRIIEYLWRNYERKPILSFVDQRYASGDGHETIGFTQLEKAPETYLWVIPDRIQHQRYFSNDNKMARNLLYFNPEHSNEDNIKANGIYKLWIPSKRRLLLKPE